MDGPQRPFSHMKSFRRSGSYPIQTSDYAPSTTTARTLSVDETSNSLPTSIRALTNAKESGGHGRTLIICLDGTGDQFDGDNSNVVHFVSCLKKHTPGEQVTYYQAGIGTYGKGGLSSGFSAGLDMAVGSGLGVHVKDAYRFLMQNYREGDKICLLGFSRGAYTVRCLAGMLHKVGLLPAGNRAQVNFAYKFYKDGSADGLKMSSDFKRTFCTSVAVYFIGIWDCVASVGFVPRKLPFSQSATGSIHYFRHAMALDEHRAKFKVLQYQQQTLDVTKADSANEVKHVIKSTINGTADGIPLDPEQLEEKVQGIKRANTAEQQDLLDAYFEAYERTHSNRTKTETDVLEVWFMGAHADCGGGACANSVRNKLSQIPLRWMLRQCFECNTGILFDTGALVEQGLDVHALYPVYQKPTRPACGPPPLLMEKHRRDQVPPLRMRRALLSIGEDKVDTQSMLFAKESSEMRHLALLSENTENQFDAMSPINDQLKDAKGWWILEVWPIKVRVLCKEALNWEKKIRWNMGRYRAVRESEPKMHWTVQHMIDEGKYQIRGRTAKNVEWQIVA